MSELNNEEKKSEEENNNEQKNDEINEDDDDIDSTNNLMDKLTFGCSNSSFKTPQVNTINFETDSNKKETEKDESEIYAISDEYKNILSLRNKLDQNIENNLEKENKNLNNNNINNINNNDDKTTINQSLLDLFLGNRNKNDIISIHSTKNDITSNNYSFKNDKQSLINKLNGNRPKNDIISMNSNTNYNETNNDTESVNQSLMNLIANKNDIISLKSKDNRQNNLNLEDMFEAYERNLRLDKINKKYDKSGFMHIYSDNIIKDNKHVQIIDENQKNQSEKLYIFKNDEMINRYKNIKMPKKNKIDETKYYDILVNDNTNINKKVHYSKFFSSIKEGQKGN